ncbi:MAG: 1-phosphofructokinase family hexose kinase [Lachnospiraceae bacterium]
MIITVTLNPAFDKTVYVPGFKQGRLNRVEKVVVTPGGKGINVSLWLKKQGEDSVAVGIFGGTTGMAIVNELGVKGIATEPVYTSGDSRTNTKIISGGELTEINEPGPVVNEACRERLFEVIHKYAKPENIFVFSGSVPQSMEDSIYYELISMVKKAGAFTILDADGDAFKEGMKAVPYAVKPNLQELFSYIDRDFGGTIPENYKSYVVSYAEEIINMGVKQVVVSLGEDGAYFTDGFNNMFMESRVSNSDVKSTVGAGDSIVASMAYALEKQMDFDAMADLAMGMSAQACRTEGTVE